MIEKAHLENEGMENVQHGKSMTMFTPENDKKVTPGK